MTRGGLLWLAFAGSICVAAPKLSKPSKAPASEATRTPECKALKWSGSFELEHMQTQFGQVPRSTLVQIAWGESLADPNNSAAGPAIYYLYATESHGPLKKYYQSIADELGDGKFTLRGLIARYPIRKGNSKVGRKLSELCEGYEVALQEHDTYVTDYSGRPKR